MNREEREEREERERQAPRVCNVTNSCQPYAATYQNYTYKQTLYKTVYKTHALTHALTHVLTYVLHIAAKQARNTCNGTTKKAILKIFASPTGNQDDDKTRTWQPYTPAYRLQLCPPHTFYMYTVSFFCVSCAFSVCLLAFIYTGKQRRRTTSFIATLPLKRD